MPDTAPMPPATAAVPAERHLGAAPAAPPDRYILGELLGSGGMATVHLGVVREPDGSRVVVAVKRVSAAFGAANDEGVAMLRDEARIAGSIRHSNVVHVRDAIVLEGELAIVMDYVPGASLADALDALRTRRERVPLPVAAAIIADVLAGLTAAHGARDERGEPLEIAHRDVSPQNILLDETGHARLSDFGIAVARGRIQKTTDAGTIKGKAGYLAPEQIHGSGGQASDLYACGAVLWELLAGRPLFTGSPAEIFAAALLGDFDPPSAHAPELPPALDRVVLDALAREPGQRPPSAAALREALTAAVAIASPETVAGWLGSLLGAALGERRSKVERLLASVPLIGRGATDVPPVVGVRVPADDGSKRRGRGAWLTLVAVAALVTIAGAGLALAWARPAAPPAEGQSRSTVGAPPASASPSPIVSVRVVSEPPSPPPAPAEPTLPSSSPAHATTRPHAKPARSGSVDCSLPYMLDAEGRTVWRRECFKK